MGAHYCNLWKLVLLISDFVILVVISLSMFFSEQNKTSAERLREAWEFFWTNFDIKDMTNPMTLFAWSCVILWAFIIVWVVFWWYCPGRIGLRRKTSDWMGLQTQLRYLSGNRNAQIHPTRARRPREDEIIDDILDDAFMEDAEFINDSHLVVVDVPIDQPENQFRCSPPNAVCLSTLKDFLKDNFVHFAVSSVCFIYLVCLEFCVNFVSVN